MNKVILVGHVGNVPEVKSKNVVTFNVATTENWLDGEGNKQESTEWHSIVAFGGKGKNCAKYLGKGSLVSIEGRLSTSSFDRADGTKGYNTQVVLLSIEFLRRSQSQN